MKKIIISINLHLLKNETHVQFNENINGIFIKYSPQTLGIKALYDLYKSAFDNETAALDIIRKSELTAKITEQDNRRDSIYRGFADTVKGAMNHFDPACAQAAETLYDIFRHYGNIARKTLDDETAAINDLLRELSLPTAAQAVTLLGLTSWSNKLAEENTLFAELMTERYVEAAEQTPFRMKETRIETDRYYHAIVNQLENQWLTGVTALEAVIGEMNAVIERFKNILAHEKAAKGKSEKLESL
ncbi:MAG: DUF6261 family protein [Prevotellaceae bacterium]|jgi:hypothetical protein|nr:DUF6261 family protein [Prevotellaceae bacterium]